MAEHNIALTLFNKMQLKKRLVHLFNLFQNGLGQLITPWQLIVPWQSIVSQRSIVPRQFIARNVSNKLSSFKYPNAI